MKNVVSCRAGAGAQLRASEPWEPGKPVSFIYAPSGVHTITAGFRKCDCITMTLEVDAATPARLQRSFEAMVAANRQLPYADEDHDARKATVRFPAQGTKFSWGQVGTDTGVVVSGADPTSYGAETVNGKVYASWSPEFGTDADYDKAVCLKCSAQAAKCECDVTHFGFPDGVRGSTSNPARMTDVNFVLGALTNKPAFHAMPPVKAKDATDPDAQVVATQVAPEGNNVVQASWSDAARAAALEARKRNGLHGQALKPGDVVGFHTPVEAGEEHAVHVVEDRDDRVLVQHQHGFENWKIKAQSVYLKKDLFMHPADKPADPHRAKAAKDHQTLAMKHTDKALKLREQINSESDPAKRLSLERAANLHKVVGEAYAASSRAHTSESRDDHRKAHEAHNEAAHQAERNDKYDVALKHHGMAAFHRMHAENLQASEVEDFSAPVVQAAQPPTNSDTVLARLAGVTVQAAGGAYAPGHEFHGNQYAEGHHYETEMQQTAATEHHAFLKRLGATVGPIVAHLHEGKHLPGFSVTDGGKTHHRLFTKGGSIVKKQATTQASEPAKPDSNTILARLAGTGTPAACN